MNRILLFVLWIAIWLGVSVLPVPARDELPQLATEGYLTSGRNYTHAIYNTANKLISFPIRDLLHEVEQRGDAQPITDVLVIAHGWNYTLAEGLARYEKYLAAIDAKIPQVHAEDPQFQPYIVFINWISAVRPSAELASSVLLYDLDESLRPLTSSIDGGLFYLFSAWKESLHASMNALGHQAPETYRRQRIEDVPYDRQWRRSGQDVPVSFLLYELIRLNHEQRLRPDGRVRIHCIGHSFGAKMLMLASMEALLRHELDYGRKGLPYTDNPIESLILFQPAFHPSEIAYPSGTFWPTLEPDLLRYIPRKAIVYSNYDYANGLIFEFSQMILSNAQVQLAQRKLNFAGATSRIGGPGVFRQVAATVTHPPVALLKLAYDLVSGPVIWLGMKGYNLPSDFMYHVHHGETLRSPDRNPEFVRWPQYVFNGIHFFCPVDQLLLPGRKADQKGLFRFAKPALGRTGLYRAGAGRKPGPNLGFIGSGNLQEFVDPDSEIDAATFYSFSRQLGCAGLTKSLSRDRFYSFDGSKVYRRLWPPDGAHNCLINTPKQWNHTFNFVMNLTNERLLPVE